MLRNSRKGFSTPTKVIIVKKARKTYGSKSSKKPATRKRTTRTRRVTRKRTTRRK